VAAAAMMVIVVVVVVVIVVVIVVIVVVIIVVAIAIAITISVASVNKVIIRAHFEASHAAAELASTGCIESAASENTDVAAFEVTAIMFFITVAIAIAIVIVAVVVALVAIATIVVLLISRMCGEERHHGDCSRSQRNRQTSHVSSLIRRRKCRRCD
jgi:ABC-type transport system involved in multi-copper enzyme maturation permease subunit